MLHRPGLDQPLHVQYLDYVGRLLHGDLGQSLISREAVSKDCRPFPPPPRARWP